MCHLSYMCIFLNIITVTYSLNPNIILFLTDDQDLLLDGMGHMKNTISLIQNKGVTFQNAFVNAPICCPSRSSILTGKYPHNTEVYNNSISGGCASSNWRQNLEPFSVASLLQNNSFYTTFYAGKYLNQYGSTKMGNKIYVPTGWNSWYGLIGNSRYYNYSLYENGTLIHYKNEYLTDVIKNKALNFLQNNLKLNKPVFMILAPPAPHAPFTPAPRHQNKFPNVKVFRTPAFNYTPIDKHWLLRMPPNHLPQNVTSLDKIQQHRLEALLAVDEMVKDILKKLENDGQLNNTYILYTSDNGYHIGQFNQPWDKRQPYDTDIRVPFFIRGPGLREKSVTVLPFQSVDIVPTILQMANLSIPDYIDGRGLLKHIKKHAHFKPNEKWSRNILIEYHGEGNNKTNNPNCPWSQDENLAECGIDSWCKCQDSRNNTYNCIRRLSSTPEDIILCRFKDNENFVEVYDMSKDKYQLNNIYKTIQKNYFDKLDLKLRKLIDCKGKMCRNI